ncbi:hypothetical protein [Methylorubrum thiocyanatum]
MQHEDRIDTPDRSLSRPVPALTTILMLKIDAGSLEESLDASPGRPFPWD